MISKFIRKYVVLDEESNWLIKNAMDRLGLSARAYERILKVARTVDDLVGEENVKTHHLSEAIHYRSLDRENWGG
jgi:magnesium chelatase family protein